MKDLEGDKMSEVLELLQSVEKGTTNAGIRLEPEVGVGGVKKTSPVSVNTAEWDGNKAREVLVHDKDDGIELSSIDGSNSTRDKMETQNVTVRENVVQVTEGTRPAKKAKVKRRKKQQWWRSEYRAYNTGQ